MLVKEFIGSAFLIEIREMTIRTDRAYAYLGFGLISQSVEFLGACLDPYAWEQRGISTDRFRLAITELFPDKYNDLAKGKFDLYSNLRCSLVHTSGPGNLISLSERKHEVEANLKDMHLKIQNNKLLLIYEDFLQDFENACHKLLSMIENKEIQFDKVYNHIISIPSDNNKKNRNGYSINKI